MNKGSPLLELPKPQTLEPEDSNTEEQERETDPLKTSLNKSQGRLTAKSFVDYDQRKEKAEQGLKNFEFCVIYTNTYVHGCGSIFFILETTFSFVLSCYFYA